MPQYIEYERRVCKTCVHVHKYRYVISIYIVWFSNVLKVGIFLIAQKDVH